MADMTRAEHLQWAKDRALAYVDRGDTNQAMASMFSDLGKHPELANHVGVNMGMMMLMGGNLKEVREFILGFK